MAVAKWERSRNRYGLWNGTVRIGYIGKEQGYRRWWWSTDFPPLTSGMASSLKEAKAEVERIVNQTERK